MSHTKINISGCEIDVIGVPNMLGAALVDQFRPYIGGIEKACMVHMETTGAHPSAYEIHIDRGRGKLRLVKVIEEFDWPPA